MGRRLLHREQAALVYCPRTHAYFRHEAYPLSSLLESGVRMAVGTDSRASNPDLDMLAELRFLARRHPDVSPALLLRMATLDGAWALGLDRQFGSLTVGKRSRMQTISLPPDGLQDPYSWLECDAR